MDDEIAAVIDPLGFQGVSLGSFRCHETNIPGAATGGRNLSFVTSMRINPTLALRCVLALLMGLPGFASFAADETRPAGEILPIQFTLDRPIDAGAAPFIVAASDGLFAAERLTVSTDVAANRRKRLPASPRAPANSHWWTSTS